MPFMLVSGLGDSPLHAAQRAIKKNVIFAAIADPIRFELDMEIPPCSSNVR
jgi:hypothetical protein